MKLPAMKCDIEFGPNNSATFCSDKKKVHFYNHHEWSARTGLVKLANGKTYRAVIECCDHDSGEHYGTMIWTGSGLLDLHDSKAQEMLGLKTKDIFPYSYKHDTPIAGDCHVGPDGWSRQNKQEGVR